MNSSRFFKSWVVYYKKTFFLEKGWDDNFLIVSIFKECGSLRDLASVVENGVHKSGDVYFFEDICLINISSPHIGQADIDGNGQWAVIRGREPCGAISIELTLCWHGEGGVYKEIVEVLESEIIS